jgi:hypothetical protein
MSGEYEASLVRISAEREISCPLSKPVSVPTSLSETRGSRAVCGDKDVPGATWPESVLNKKTNISANTVEYVFS